jgi:nucleotide-binding universal stress UspA family protein
MPIRDILVHLDAEEHGENRLQLAADLARRHGAHPSGLHVHDVLLPLIAGESSSGAVRRDGIAGDWHPLEGVASARVVLHGRDAGLLVVDQEDLEAPRKADGAVIEAALFSSGRPVLVVPHSGRFETAGRRVPIGWNASREATRAVHATLPLIAQAEAVTVLPVNPRPGAMEHVGGLAADWFLRWLAPEVNHVPV